MEQQTIDFLKILNREPLDSSVDWIWMSKMARKQNILPLFFEAASFYEEYMVATVYQNDQSDTYAMVTTQIQHTGAFLEVYEEFLRQGISPIVLKGIICRKLYGEYGDHRPSGDEDVLIPQEAYLKVKDILERYGYMCTLPDITERELTHIQEVSFFNQELALTIEVHVNAIGKENATREQMNNYFIDARERMRIMEVDGTKLYTMDPTDSFLFLVLHMFKHFQYRGAGIRQMIDILMFYKTYENEINWERVKTLLCESKAELFLNDIIYLGTAHLGFQLKQIGDTCCPEELMEELMQAGVFGGKEKSDVLASNINLSLIGDESKHSKIKMLFRAGFPSKKQLLTRYPYLEEKPWLLPVVWSNRWYKFFRNERKDARKIINETLTKCSARAAILKKYGI